MIDLKASIKVRIRRVAGWFWLTLPVEASGHAR